MKKISCLSLMAATCLFAENHDAKTEKKKEEKPQTVEMCEEATPHHKKDNASHHENLSKRVDDLEKKLAEKDAQSASKAKVEFSGNVNMYGAYFSKNRPNSDALTTSPNAVVFNNQKVNGITPTSRHIGMYVDGTTLSSKTRVEDLFVQLDIGFSGGNKKDGTIGAILAVADAHVEYKGIFAGYTYSNFTDPNALGDWMLCSGLQESQFGVYNILAGYNYKLCDCLSFKFAVETPDVDGMEQNTTNATLASSSYGKLVQPDLTFQTVFNHARGHVSFRMMEKRQVFKNGNVFDKSVPGFGFGLSTKYNVFGKTNVYGQMVTGRGIGSYLGELNDKSVLLDTTDNANVKIAALKTTSFLLGTQIFLKDSVWINLGYQQTNISYPKWALKNVASTYAGNDQLDKRHNKYMTGISWQFANNLKAGFEVAYVSRKISNTINNDSRRKTNNTIGMIGVKATF